MILHLDYKIADLDTKLIGFAKQNTEHKQKINLHFIF